MADEKDRLDWLKRSSAKRNTTSKRAQRDEKQAGGKYNFKQTKNSGATGFHKGDLFDSFHVLECKTTDGKQFTLHLSDMMKLKRFSCQRGVVPIFRITFGKCRRPQRFVILDEQDFHELLESQK